MKIAVLIFCYLRADKFKGTLECLSKNSGLNNYHFVVYQDGLRQTKDLVEHEIVKEHWDRFVKKNAIKSTKFMRSKVNLGLRTSIMRGITSTLNEHDAVIVLEDDLQIHEKFLYNLERLLRDYKNDTKIYHINGWSPPTFGSSKSNRLVKTKMMFCWGWGTWSHKWKKFAKKEKFEKKDTNNLKAFVGDFMGLAGFRRQLRLNSQLRIRTWAVYWYWYLFLNRKICIGPRLSLVRNTGNDGSGENCGKIELDDKFQSIFNGEVQFNGDTKAPVWYSDLKYMILVYRWLIMRDAIMLARKMRDFIFND